VWPADLGDARAVAELVDQIDRVHGGVDVLVNCAGIGWYGYFHQMSGDLSDSMQRLNIRAVAELTRRFLPAMIRARYGRVINIGSIAGQIAGQGTAVYAATKAFVDAFSRSLGRELRGTGVTVSVVRPGPVASEFFVRARIGSSYDRIPAERLGISPHVVARRVVALIRRPRQVAYVPRALSLVPFAALAFGWLLDLIGPLHLRGRARA
jgi:short-subunit dehydrogenase